MSKKLAFLFLTYDNQKNEILWEKFFNKIDKSLYNIYCHPKYKDKVTTSFLKNNIISKIAETKWASFSIVQAMINLLEEAYKDKDNYKFIFISDSCIPLYGFNYIYDFLTKNNNSFFNILYFDALKFKLIKKKIYVTSQWCILNRDHTKLHLSKFEKYKKIFLSLNIAENSIGAYDELYFYNVIRMENNLENIEKMMTTYVKWNYEINKFHPMTFNKINKQILKEFINFNSLFSRKFIKVDDILLKLLDKSAMTERLKLVNDIKLKDNLICTIFEPSDIKNKLKYFNDLKYNFDTLLILSTKYNFKINSSEIDIFDYYFKYSGIFPTSLLINLINANMSSFFLDYKNYILIQQDLDVNQDIINELLKIHEKNNNLVTTIKVPNLGLDIKYLPVFFILSSEFIEHVKLYNLSIKIEIEDFIPGFKHVLPKDRFQIVDNPKIKLNKNYLENFKYYKYKESKINK